MSQAPARELVIGLDSSTTACKALVYDAAGRVLAEGRASLPMRMPRPAWHEQPAEAWWQSAQEALRQATAQVDERRLAGISIAAQRETFVVTGAAGTPRGAALLWMDERARAVLPEIAHRYGADKFHRETGKPLSANLSAAKLAWLQAHEPARLRGGRVLDVHAYLAGHLCGRWATSWGCADPMGLFDMTTNAWNASLIAFLGLESGQFPEALPAGALLGEVTPEAARLTGLPAGLPLFAGLGDGQAAGLGVRAVEPGEAYLNLGTAVVTGAPSPDYLTAPAFRTMYSGLPGQYVLETVLLGGAYTVNWFVEQFGAGRSPAELEEEAARVPPGAEGLVLVPYWNSAMNPYWDASASGTVTGWRGAHGRAHFYRAVLEGIALELRLHASSVESALGRPVERYIAVGGGARSPLWRQILADVTGKPIFLAGDAPEHLEASALGAAILAAAGCGLHSGIREAAQAMAQRAASPAALPDPQRQAFYLRLYEEVYRQLYPALRDIQSRLADLVEEHKAV